MEAREQRDRLERRVDRALRELQGVLEKWGHLELQDRLAPPVLRELLGALDRLAARAVRAELELQALRDQPPR